MGLRGVGSVLKLGSSVVCSTVYIYQDSLTCALTMGELYYVNYTS